MQHEGNKNQSMLYTAVEAMQHISYMINTDAYSALITSKQLKLADQAALKSFIPLQQLTREAQAVRRINIWHCS